MPIEFLPLPENRVTLASEKDRYGVPVANFSYSLCDNDRQNIAYATKVMEEIWEHAEAQDTLDGILHWWVLDSCIKRWAPKIAETVANLVEQGFLEEKPSPDGHTFYHVSSHYLATLQRRPSHAR